MKQIGETQDTNADKHNLAHRRLWAGIVCCGAISLATVATWMLVETRSLAPQPALEDAAMLFRYAQNLADGYGIAWNAGEAPGLTDGATDLGFVLILAPLIWAGLPVATAAFILNLTSVLALGALFGWAGKRLWNLPWLAIGLLIVLLFSGPVNRYVSSGFSPPIFGLILTAIAVAAFVFASNPGLKRSQWFLLGLLAGLSGWWRPEGFALGAIVVIAAVACALPTRDVRCFVQQLNWLALAAGFLIMVFSWGVFRVLYFGHLLPSSAVLKSGGLNRANALESLQVITLSLLPLLAVVIVVAIMRSSRIWVLLLAMLGSSIVWMPAVLHLNWWNRMQWPLIPALAAVAIASVHGALRRSPEHRGLIALSSATIIGLCSIAILRAYSIPEPVYTQYQPHTAISQALEKVDTSSVRVATSEAGLIPLAVDGPALDTYGFNNYPIASSDGTALWDEMERLQPNVVIVNGPAPPEVVDNLQDPSCVDVDLEAYLGERWLKMAETMIRFAEMNQMELLRSTETGRCVVFSLYASSNLSQPVLDALLVNTRDSAEILGRSR